jgi:hypothetical protein
MPYLRDGLERRARAQERLRRSDQSDAALSRSDRGGCAGRLRGRSGARMEHHRGPKITPVLHKNDQSRSRRRAPRGLDRADWSRTVGGRTCRRRVGGDRIVEQLTFALLSREHHDHNSRDHSQDHERHDQTHQAHRPASSPSDETARPPFAARTGYSCRRPLPGKVTRDPLPRVVESAGTYVTGVGHHGRPGLPGVRSASIVR